MTKHPIFPFALVAAMTACSSPGDSARGTGPVVVTPSVDAQVAPATPDLRHPDEKHLADIRQLTFGGENAEAYWSYDDKSLIFQTKRPPWKCDQIMTMPIDGSAKPTLVSTGKGRTTCAYYMPGNQEVVWSSTHHKAEACPPEIPRSLMRKLGYVWPLYSYDVYKSNADGSNLRKLTDTPHYDAEATVCPKTGDIIFTSTRDGDLDLYRMDADGKNVKRLTKAMGYDGGAFFSPDCTQIVWRASRPTGEALKEYKDLLGKNMVRPSKLEIYVAKADGSDVRQITNLGVAAFAPYFHPSGKRVLFSTNYGDPRGREFDIWAVNTDGTQLERITYAKKFDGFPMFSFDGKTLAFASNRNGAKRGDTNVFVARWVDSPPVAAERAPDRLKRDIVWLADDAREGRGIGTKGLEVAGDWLAAEFKKIGLHVIKQKFDVVVSVENKGSQMSIGKRGVVADTFIPTSFSASKKVTARTVFAGYGIVAKALKHDDYRGKRVKGKIVVVRRFVPEGKQWKAPKVRRRHSDMRYKAFLAKERGAAGMIIVDLPVTKRGVAMPEEASLPKLRASDMSDVGIPVVIVKRGVGKKLIGRRAQTVLVDVRLVQKSKPTYNIIGVLGITKKTLHSTKVVIGAHYDHLGFGGRGSLEPGKRAVHNGADDNASGTAALLEAARILAKDDQRYRGVTFVAFSAEESGVLGSAHFVKNLPMGAKPSDVFAMLNMDMVGRMRSGQLSVLGAASATEWKSIVEPACARQGVACTIGGSGYGPSDHMPFYLAGIPVLHFFTGAHPQYHKTSDDTGLINALGAAQTAKLVADVAHTLIQVPTRLTYKKAPPRLPRGDRRSFGASLGSVPDYSNPGGKPGVLLSGVVAGGAAEKGGLKRGDRIIKIGKTEVRTVRDLMYVLMRARPGQKARVVAIRDGKQMIFTIIYHKSSRRH